MVIVNVLIRAEAGKVWDVCKAIESIDGVNKAHVVTGPYDVIAYADLPSTEDVRRLMQSIHDIEGVTRTETCIAI
jgi:DNA-binding Lrp family transcriptional regulator